MVKSSQNQPVKKKRNTRGMGSIRQKNGGYEGRITIKVNGKQKSKLIKKIKKGKYFLKIKSYVEIGGKKYYSEWSKIIRK